MRIVPPAFLYVLWFTHCVKVDCVSRDITCSPALFALRGPRTAAPVFSPAAGYYASAQTITLMSSTSASIIYYTIDGSTPTTSSGVFSSGFPIWSAAGKTIKAYAVKSGIADSEVVSGRFSYHTMQTGQTVSYAAGDDGARKDGVSVSFTGPTPHSVYVNDYTTIDNSTGLLWKTCTEGQSGPACGTGGVSLLTLDQATTACAALNAANSGSGYAARTNWRLPTMRELMTLSDFSLAALTMYSTPYFPGTAAYAYWSSTIYGPNPWVPPNGGFGWYVDYTFGNTYATFSFSPNYHARCVSAPAMPEAQDYTDIGDGTVSDNVTGLIWQKCSMGQNNDATCSGAATAAASWNAAIGYCSALSLSGKTWRLPNVNELASLQDYAVASGAKINQLFFPNTQTATYYWTSTTYAANTAMTWYVNFGSFNALFDAITKADATTNVRCVTNP